MVRILIREIGKYKEVIFQFGNTEVNIGLLDESERIELLGELLDASVELRN